VMPFCWWWAKRRREGHGGILAAAVIGLALGIVLELAQFLLVSGTSQGASALVRGAGAAAGAGLYAERGRIAALDLARWGRPIVMAALLPYLAAVGYVGGWLGGDWLGLEEGLARFGEVKWLPFYYQYFTTEQALIRSTLLHLALFLPVGAGVWLWGRGRRRISPAAAAALAAAIAFVVESGKLFLAGKHPDYTDVLLAASAGWVAATVLRWASVPARPVVPASWQARAEQDATPHAESGVPISHAAAMSAVSASWTGRTAGVALVLIAAVSVVLFPLWQVPLALALAVYALLLIRRPTAYLLVLPAALMLLDIAPFSGRFFWDEIDFLLAMTFGVRLLMPSPASQRGARLPTAAGLLLALSVVISAAVALWPLPPLDANSFTTYLSNYNALRVGKGYLWGGALLWLIRRDAVIDRSVGTRLELGLAIGLGAAVLGVFVERILFVGLTGLTNGFRAAGVVSANHVGGAYLETALVMLAPFALALSVVGPRASLRVLWFGVSLLGAAAVLMTLSRTAFVAWLVVVSVFVLLWWVRSARAGAVRLLTHWRWLAGAAIAGMVTLTAVLAQSTYLRERFALSGADLSVRAAHWRDTVELMPRDVLHMAFGMGLGSFPREFYLGEASRLKLPSYRQEREAGAGGQFLSLYGGKGMYLDQRIGAEAGRDLRLRGQIRASSEKGRLSLSLCEKSFLESVRCESAEVVAGTEWQPFEIKLMLPAGERSRLGVSVPISLSLHNGTFGTRIDVTQLSLSDAERELLSNGSFEHGMDRWFMFSDVHLAWRALSTWVQVFFEQGLLGLAAWLAVGVAVLAAALNRRTAPTTTAALLASVAGAVLIWTFDSLLDSPRILALLALIAAASAVSSSGVAGADAPRVQT